MLALRFRCVIVLLCLLPNWAMAQDQAETTFQRWDRDGNGTLEKSELPRAAQRNFSTADTDGSGTISFDEHQAFLSRMPQPTPRTRTNPNVPQNVTLIRDIAYVDEGHVRQKLDLYLPKQHADKLGDTNTASKLPVVVWIHGGGWRGGNRFPCPAASFAQKGFVVASIGYRLTDAAIFPAQIHDCKSAIRFLRKHATKYGLDKDRIGAWGASAGGHLVALLGTSGDTSKLDGEVGVREGSATLQAICDYYGPTDLLKMQAQSNGDSRLNHDAANSPESLLVGGKLQEHPDQAQAANPIGYVSKQDPPFLIVHGNKDPLVPYQQSEMLRDALQAAGVDVELVLVPDGGHGPFRSPEQIERVLTFFQKHLAADN